MILFLGIIPLWLPALPPLSDLPGHMGRWHVEMNIGQSSALAHYYAVVWKPIGNLGMDLLVPALATILPFEVAAKCGVMLIPLLTMAGLLWSAFEAHGRVPPTALMALPLAYAWPFQFGFVNFALAQGLAFCGFALWLRFGRQHRFKLRALIFLPFACGLWLTHSFGWVMFGLMAAGAELARLRLEKRSWLAAFTAAGIQCLPLALPVVLMAMSSEGQGLRTDDWFNLAAKLLWVVSILRDRWAVLDIASLVPIFIVLHVAARNPKLGFSALLGWPALLCFLAFILLPRLALGGSYVDMRIAPTMVMLSLIAIAPPAESARFAQTLAVVAATFFVTRTAATTVSFALRSNEQQRELAAIPFIPRGGSVLSLVARPCGGVWSDLRRDQLSGIAIVRRDVFTNSQWSLDGQQLLHVRHVAAAPYLTDPTQLVYPRACPDIGSNFATAIRGFPRAGFTHVWTIGFPPAALGSDLQLIWTNGSSTLYRVRHRFTPTTSLPHPNRGAKARYR